MYLIQTFILIGVRPHGDTKKLRDQQEEKVGGTLKLEEEL